MEKKSAKLPMIAVADPKIEACWGEHFRFFKSRNTSIHYKMNDPRSSKIQGAT
jgi:hypothetical protein